MQCGGVAATYESCSTSAFKHGRTETVRPATLQTKAFSDAVCGVGGTAHSTTDLKRMIMECSAQHGELTKQAAMGQYAVYLADKNVPKVIWLPRKQNYFKDYKSTSQTKMSQKF